MTRGAAAPIGRARARRPRPLAAALARHALPGKVAPGAARAAGELGMRRKAGARGSHRWSARRRAAGAMKREPAKAKPPGADAVGKGLPPLKRPAGDADACRRQSGDAAPRAAGGAEGRGLRQNARRDAEPHLAPHVSRFGPPRGRLPGQ